MTGNSLLGALDQNTAQNREKTETKVRNIVKLAATVFQKIGPGFVKGVYHKALMHELRKQGLTFEGNKRMQVIYDGVVVGDFIADIFVAGEIMVEVRAQNNVSEAEERIIINHLNVAGVPCGLLLNFGGRILESKSFFRE